MASISSVNSHINVKVEIMIIQVTQNINIGSTGVIRSVVDSEGRTDRHVIVVPEYLQYYSINNYHPYQTSKFV